MQVSTPGIGIILSFLNLTWFSRILRGALLLIAKTSPKKDGAALKDVGDNAVPEFKKDT